MPLASRHGLRGPACTGPAARSRTEMFGAGRPISAPASSMGPRGSRRVSPALRQGTLALALCPRHSYPGRRPRLPPLLESRLNRGDRGVLSNSAGAKSTPLRLC
eukprot:scaffold49_cov409-Prasinococcus_capsulatus_cf.AAC.40